MRRSIKVRLFAGLREASGASELELEIREPITVKRVRRKLGEHLPEMQAMISRCLFAQGTAYMHDDDSVDADQIVSVIPPVSGG